jgi:2-phospho-L-lactate guanylyltransferase
VLAVVPFKGLAGAKTRLAGALRNEERAALARELLMHVLTACEGARSIERTLLVTPDPSGLGDKLDVLVDAGSGHADAIDLALADPRAGNGALVVMADCPFADADALDRLAEAAQPLALVPSNDGGVNALAMRSLNGFRPHFGVQAETMISAARAQGLDPVVVPDARLAFDVDRPGDLALL